MTDLRENSALKNTPQDHSLSDALNKAAAAPPKNAPPLVIGQKVHAAAAGSLGEGEGASDSRLKSVAKVLGGVAISASITLGVKALIPLVLTAALPAAAASVAIPIALVLFTGYGLMKDAIKLDKKIKKSHLKHKAEGLPTKESLLTAIRDNKVETGAFVGAVALSAVGLGQNASEFASALAGSQEIIKDVGTELAKNGSSKFLAAAAMSAGQVVAADGILDTVVAGSERVIERGHRLHIEHLAEKAALSHKSLTEAVHKKLNVAHPAQILKSQMKRFKPLVRLKTRKSPAKPASRASSHKL